MQIYLSSTVSVEMMGNKRLKNFCDLQFTRQIAMKILAKHSALFGHHWVIDAESVLWFQKGKV